MRGRWLILAGVAIAVVNGVGCGGSEHATVDPEELLDSAAAHPIESADLDVDASLRVDGVARLSGPLRVRLEGPFRSGGGERIPSFDWHLSASALGFPVGGRLVSTGENVYLTVYGNGYEVGPAGVAAANARLEASGGLRPDVRSWLGAARVTGQGSEGGEDCERISAPLRGQRMQRDLAPLAGSLGFALSRPTGRATACVGFDDRVLHELELDASMAVPPGSQSRLGGASALHLDADVVVSDVGQSDRIEAPGGEFRPIRDLFLTLNDLAG